MKTAMTDAQQLRASTAWRQNGYPVHVFVPWVPGQAELCRICTGPRDGVPQHRGWCMGTAEHAEHTFNQGAHCDGLPDLTRDDQAEKKLGELARKAREYAAPGYEDEAWAIVRQAFDLGRENS